MREDEPETGRPVGAPRHPCRVRVAASLLAVMVLAGCSAVGANAKTPKDTAPVGTMASRPNIVFVLADDLSTNLVPYMPHVRSMMRRGATFTNYYVTDSLCCPSRASIFTGRYPHNTGVFKNSGRDGGYWTFDRHRNPGRTFAVALQRSGYRTALMGKYLNGYKPGLQFHFSRPYVPEGWNDWDVAGNGYGEYGYSLNQNHRIVRYGGAPRSYLTNVLARLAKKYVARRGLAADGSRRPFALEVATFAPHEPYVPAPGDGRRFRWARAPRTPAFGHHDRMGNPRWLDQPPLTPAAVTSIDRDFRRRVRSVQAIDRMLGALQRAVRANGLASNTYFVFSSDNGYHMGEHRLRPGKMTAFDTDIRVPLVVVGPGIRPGTRIDALTENIDLAPTFEELAGHTPPPSVDGRSLVPLLEGRRAASAGGARCSSSTTVPTSTGRPRLSATGQRQPALVRGDSPRGCAVRRVRRRRARVLRHRDRSVRAPQRLRRAQSGAARRVAPQRDAAGTVSRCGELSPRRSAAAAAFEAAEHADDVAADHVEVVAALLHEHRREAQARDRGAETRIVVADELERVVVLGRGVDAERHDEPVGREPRDRRRSRRRAPARRRPSRCRAGAGSCAWSSPAPRRPSRRRSPRRTGTRGPDRRAARRSTRRRAPRRSAACRCRGGSRRRGSRRARPRSAHAAGRRSAALLRKQ